MIWAVTLPFCWPISRMITSSHEGCWGQVIFCNCVEVSTRSKPFFAEAGDSRIPVRPNISGVCMTAVKGHATSHAVADSTHGQSINCKAHALVVRPSPSSPAASTPQNLTSGRRLSRRAPKFLILEVIGLERAEPILITASRSQDVIRSARRDPARVSSLADSGVLF
jgi:hypothetical protein